MYSLYPFFQRINLYQKLTKSILAEQRLLQADNFDKKEGISDTEMTQRFQKVSDPKKRAKTTRTDSKGFKIPKV